MVKWFHLISLIDFCIVGTSPLSPIVQPFFCKKKSRKRVQTGVIPYFRLKKPLYPYLIITLPGVLISTRTSTRTPVVPLDIHERHCRTFFLYFLVWAWAGTKKKGKTIAGLALGCHLPFVSLDSLHSFGYFFFFKLNERFLQIQSIAWRGNQPFGEFINPIVNPRQRQLLD